MTTTYKHKLFEAKQPKRQQWILSLLPSDGKKNEVKSKVCINPDCAKKPEQAGWAFSKLEIKAWRAKMKEQIKAGNDKDADGNKIELSDSEDEEIIVLDKVDEKWVPTRTREEFIKCGVEGDLYGILDLKPFTLPFYSDEEIEK